VAKYHRFRILVCVIPNVLTPSPLNGYCSTITAHMIVLPLQGLPPFHGLHWSIYTILW
jgi:hypothetical protein